MKAWIVLSLLALPLPAVAADCAHWTAAMEEDEGGKVMMAHICAPTGNAVHELYVQCGEPGKFSIRFIPVAPSNYPPSGDFKTEIEFSMDQEMFTRPAQYEDMDGAMAMDADIDSPFVSVLQTQKQVSLSDVNGKVPGATFTLKGSKAALAKVISSCSGQ